MSLLYHMGHQLMVAKPECHGAAGFSSKDASEPIDVEPFGRLDIVDRKGQMKQDTAHLQRPLTVGLPDPSHQPAAMCGVTCAIENRPSLIITNVPAAPWIRETNWRRAVVAASFGAWPAASRSQMVFASARRIMPSPCPVMDTAPLRLSA